MRVRTNAPNRLAGWGRLSFDAQLASENLRRRTASLFGGGQMLIDQRLNCQPDTTLRHYYL